MTTKMTGAEYKAWLNSNWGEGVYWDNTITEVNGVEFEDIGPDEIQDNDVIRVLAGDVYASADDRDPISADTHIRRWRKSVSTQVLVFTVPKEKADAVRAAVAAALKA